MAKVKTEQPKTIPDSGMVTVVGVTGGLKAGKEYIVNAKLAQTLIKKGSATLKS